MKRGALALVSLALLLGVLVGVWYFVAPRTVVVLGLGAEREGLAVETLKLAEEKATTNARGVATFGRGPWLPWAAKDRYIVIKVSRGETTLFEGLKIVPRWGAIEVPIAKPQG